MATYVIVGGVAGGATAAARLRRRDEHANIIVLERGPYVSFANCGLPYYVGEAIPQRDALLVSTPEKLHGEFNLDVRTRHEVVGINRGAKTVQVHDLADGRIFDLAYDRLILAPGAKPLVPPIPGVDLPGVYRMRDLPDTDAIKAHVDSGAKRAVVIGGGFIGLEMAENLVARGLHTTIVEMLPQVMAPLDGEMAAILHQHLQEKGVRLSLGERVTGIEARPAGGLDVLLASGGRVSGDLAILSVGVRPESDLAKAAGLELGPRGHIVVNEFMQTSDPAIYAVGDAIQVINPLTGKPTAVPLAGPANRQGRIAADHITGLANPYRGTIGTSIVKVFDLTAATTGLNSRALEGEGIPFLTATTHSYDHASYYPGATRQAIKLLYAPEDGRLWGAQVVGRDGVDRTIDVLATAITAKMTVYDLEHLELAYAPPFGSAKDPVNVAGYVASNQLRGDTDLADWRSVQALDPTTQGVLDVRTQPEFDLGHIEGAVNIPVDELRGRLGELTKDKEWIVMCAVGRRAYVAERLLRQNGYRAKTLTGGWSTYAPATAPVSAPESETRDSGTGADAASSNKETSMSTPFNSDPAEVTAHARVDARGMQCPGPILAVYKRMQQMEAGQVVEVLASDPGFRRDVGAWSERTGHELLEVSQDDHTIRALLRKAQPACEPQTVERSATTNNKTMVVFSADLDHAIASFIIANGAAAMGQHVTMFFTFWGLNILRRDTATGLVKKNMIEKMFGWMMPKGANALKLSRLNMGGMGTWMMKKVMQSKNIDSLPTLIRTARENGVRMIACQMTMDMMGIKPEELVDGVEIGGVATYINETDKANATLFI